MDHDRGARGPNGQVQKHVRVAVARVAEAILHRHEAQLAAVVVAFAAVVGTRGCIGSHREDVVEARQQLAQCLEGDRGTRHV